MDNKRPAKPYKKVNEDTDTEQVTPRYVRPGTNPNPKKPPYCRMAKQCQSCKYINQDYQTVLQEKYRNGVKVLQDAGVVGSARMIAPQASPKIFGYRTHAKLATRTMSSCVNPDRRDKFAIGLFTPNSHDIVDLHGCLVQKNNINRLISALKIKLNASPFVPYNEKTLTGDLRYIAVRSSHITDEMMLTFVMNNENYEDDLIEIVETLVDDGHNIVSAHVNINKENTNVIFGGQSNCIFGDDTLTMRLCDFAFDLGPTSFFQVNPWVAEIIYRRVEQLAGQTAHKAVAWDLYCGIGQLSLLLAGAGYRVLALEANTEAVKDGERTATANHVENMPQFIAARVEQLDEEAPEWARNPKLIITNPTRKGLSDEVTSFIKKTLDANHDCRLIYVSCEVNTLARDLAALMGEGRQLRQLEAFDMFPFTEKLEWLAVVN